MKNVGDENKQSKANEGQFDLVAGITTTTIIISIISIKTKLTIQS